LSEIGRDIKLQADQDAESIILKALAETGYSVLAEESGEHGLLEGDDPYWVVDPLDGTMNFNRGLPECCVSIALCQGQDPVMGVIYDFNRDECFQGIVGEGAWLNDAPMSVSGISERSQAVLCTGFPTHRSFDSDSLEEFIRSAQDFKKVRMLGTAALMVAYVACGRADAYLEDSIMLWDVAAGIALVRAAGGYAEMKPSPRKKWGRIVRCGSHPDLWQTESV